uniref:Disease resistance R13L4/SHOC-2-like LRR domain-containing protein n=1 Tax=Leersia perrieri TaxID=77586 RepID=A0A0D9VGW3_9ORYZ
MESPKGQDKEQQKENNNISKLNLREFDNKRVVLNINAHVYQLPNRLLSHLGGNLVVLQLGRWWNSDDNTYMEVQGLEKLSAISNLKNLRYLGIRGLSKLTELPNEISKLRQLEVLDVRGCQNLTRVTSSNVKNLRLLTHLDLTECYMLEHIGREITSLSKLQVFKGFVFSIDSRWNNVCRLQDIGAKMKHLQKLSINVTTDANVAKNEMAQLKHLSGLTSLTITWGELPSILTSEERKADRNQLLERWTSLELPPSLVKLDIRCFPDKEIPSKWFEQGPNKSKVLKKLYVRGGAVEKLNLPRDNNIETLRLRYLKAFNMKWNDMLGMMKNLRYVEVFVKDAKVMKSEKRKYQVENVKEDKKKAKDEEMKLMEKIKKEMSIPKFMLDEEGVWVKDRKDKETEQSKGAQTQMTSEISNNVEKAHNASNGVKTPTTELPKGDT